MVKKQDKESLKSPQSSQTKGLRAVSLAEEADRVSSVNQSETQSAAEIFRKYCVRTSPSSGCATESKATWRSNKRKAKGEL